MAIWPETLPVLLQELRRVEKSQAWVLSVQGAFGFQTVSFIKLQKTDLTHKYGRFMQVQHLESRK